MGRGCGKNHLAQAFLTGVLRNYSARMPISQLRDSRVNSVT
jgi:hypothetical protein